MTKFINFTAIFIYFVLNAILVLKEDEMGRVFGTYGGNYKGT
jgi:drug/metabolite transporter superfamily protein YnfA